eukprot:PhF_6_TR25617/c0_g2_i1/m.35972/K13177/DDX1; ATP-dependent RNA helicase DDX1
MSAFEELGVLPDLIRAVGEMDWDLPRPVQQDAIPLILGGGDVMCAAETGSGKTGAFCLPILQTVWETRTARLKKDNIKKRAQRCRMNPDDCMQGIQLSEDGTMMQCRDEYTWAGCRGTFGLTKGRWMYEVQVLDVGKSGQGIVRVGFSTMNAALDLGTDHNGFGYGGKKKKSTNNTFEDYGDFYTAGDTITCCVDCDARTISYCKNGKELGVAFNYPSNVGALYPALYLKNSRVKANFGDALNAFTQKPPFGGYQALALATGPEQEKLAAEFENRRMTTGQSRLPLCVIVEPTVELAVQVVDELLKFGRFLENPKIHVCSIVGKRDMGTILRELGSGMADIVVGTPGKLESLLSSGKLQLSQCRFMVLDEADRLGAENLSLVMSLYQQIRLENSQRLQICMFSATLHSPEILSLHKQICPTAMWIDMKGKDYVPETVHHVVVRVDPYDTQFQKMWNPRSQVDTTDNVHAADNLKGDLMDSYAVKVVKPLVLLEIIKTHKMEQCMIFCRTRLDCDNVARVLTDAGGGRESKGRDEKGKENLFSNVLLHSGLAHGDRAKNLELFKEGFVRFLICTDVAARGIDIRGLPYVINMTLPDKTEDYLHRVGRTGRADRMGLAISIVSDRHKEKVWYHTCPSRGDGCTNTVVAKPVGGGKYEGGCCIWYDEPALLAAVEKHLGHPLQSMNNQYKLPTELGATVYGKSKEEVKQTTRDPFLEQTADSLFQCDQESQRGFFAIVQKAAAYKAG